MDDFADSRFDLFGRCAFRAVRAVWLLHAVAQLFYKFLYHLALCSGYSRTFFVFVLSSVWLFSNVWNDTHLQNASHREIYFMENGGIERL